ncbi:MAG: tetratricopeptide repeat protein [Bacteroidetes bacterium]|nr:tetratricopeptide repeat protein [Bacteroidota bacterium]
MRITAFVFKSSLLLCPLFLSSCGVWDFFSAYFNTYYNAQRQFDEAVEEVWALPETRETGRNMLAVPAHGQTARVKFTSVIEKCSKLLQYHPESNLVDDALFMIGRSYYYQAEYQQAQRKFRELLDGYPSSDLVPQAKALLAFTLYRIPETKAAETLALEVLEEATARDDDAIIAEAALVLGQIALDAKDYKAAREFYAKVSEMGNHGDKRAQATLKVAEMYAEEGEYALAQEAYLRARSLSSGYVGGYRGLFGAARMQGRQKHFDEALDALVALRENSNYREFFGEVDVEIGHVFRDKGDLEGAIDQYRYVDTAYARTEHSANANYALGAIYEDTLHLYDSAKVAYDRGRGAPTQSLIMPQLVRRSEYLGKYLQYRTEVRRLDSTLQVLLMPPDSASISRHDSLAGPADTLNAGALRSQTTPPDSEAHPPTATQEDQRVTAGRSDDLSPRTARRARLIESTPPVVPDSQRVRAPAAPPQHPDSVRARLATALDNLAGVMYINMGLSDSARFYYQRITREFPQSNVAPRALYVLARIAGEDSTASSGVADSLYHLLIIRHPDSEFADEAHRMLGLPVAHRSTDLAERSYSRATELLASGKTRAAIDTFVTVASTFPQSPVASRALYAAGWTYENKVLLPDSAAAVYERLVNRYPASPLAKKVQPAVQEVVAMRRQALEKAYADSVAKAKTAAEKARADSIARSGPAAGKAPVDSVANGKAPTEKPPTEKAVVDSTAKAAPVVAPDTLKKKEMSTEERERLMEERRRERAKPAAPDTSSSRPNETPEEKPID